VRDCALERAIPVLAAVRSPPLAVPSIQKRYQSIPPSTWTLSCARL